MADILVSATRRRWWGTQRKNWRLWLPQSWEELRGRRRLLLFTAALTKGESALPSIVMQCNKVPKWAWIAMDPIDRAGVLAHYRWMLPRPDCTTVPFKAFTHNGVEYWLPKAKFENGTCLEFALADGYYKRYRETGDESALMKLVATLCRPAKTAEGDILASGDIRIGMVSKEQVENRANAMKGLSAAMQVAVLLYFIGVKEYVNKTFWMLFDHPPETEPDHEENPEAEPERPAGPKFGWWSKFMEVGASNLFGNYEEVLQKRLFLICMHLVDQHEINKQARAAARQNRPAHDA